MNTYYSREGRMDYSPALLGNGEISLQLDFMGQQVFEEKELDTCETPPARSVASPIYGGQAADMSMTADVF